MRIGVQQRLGQFLGTGADGLVAAAGDQRHWNELCAPLLRANR